MANTVRDYGNLLLSKNERVTPFSDPLMSELLACITVNDFNKYPNLHGLINSLAKSTGLDESRLYIAAGSEAVFSAIFDAYIRSGDAVVHLNPAWRGIHRNITRVGALSLPINHDMEFSLDESKLLAAAAKGPRAVIVTEPNASGVGLSESCLSELETICENQETLLMIDEAYHIPGKQTRIDNVKRLSNMVVVRSFSKIWGLAGMRLGYAAGSPDKIKTVASAGIRNGVSAVSARVAEYLIQNQTAVLAYREEISKGLDKLHRIANSAPFELLPTKANYVVLKLDRTLRDFEHRCSLLGLEIACYRKPHNRFVRLTLGSPYQMERAVEIIKRVMS